MPWRLAGIKAQFGPNWMRKVSNKKCFGGVVV
jgi:hypothetical protein